MELLTNCFGIVLNNTLKVMLCVFAGMKYINVTFWKEIPQQKRIKTGEYCQCVK